MTKRRIGPVAWVKDLDPTDARDPTNPYSPLNRPMAFLRITAVWIALLVAGLVIVASVVWDLVTRAF